MGVELLFNSVEFGSQSSCQQTPRGLETRCGRQGHTQPRGTLETPEGVSSRLPDLRLPSFMRLNYGVVVMLNERVNNYITLGIIVGKGYSKSPMLQMHFSILLGVVLAHYRGAVSVFFGPKLLSQKVWGKYLSIVKLLYNILNGIFCFD